MQTPPEISWLHVPPQPQIAELIDEKIAGLERLHGRITSLHVWIAAPHQRHRSGNLYAVRLEARVPGAELAAAQSPAAAARHEHLKVALREAFAGLARQLSRHKAQAAGDIKTLAPRLQGRIAELDAARGFGQIATTDHQLVYFHRNALVDGAFEALRPDDPVELVVQTGESPLGPQASTVRPIGAMRHDPAG